jgi:serine/threonine protein kinase
MFDAILQVWRSLLDDEWEHQRMLASAQHIASCLFHCDAKRSNILFDSDCMTPVGETVRLVDFGLTRSMRDDGASMKQDANCLTLPDGGLLKSLHDLGVYLFGLLAGRQAAHLAIAEASQSSALSIVHFSGHSERDAVMESQWADAALELELWLESKAVVGRSELLQQATSPLEVELGWQQTLVFPWEVLAGLRLHAKKKLRQTNTMSWATCLGPLLVCLRQLLAWSNQQRTSRTATERRRTVVCQSNQQSGIRSRELAEKSLAFRGPKSLASCQGTSS